jgi:hypothetical protein
MSLVECLDREYESYNTAETAAGRKPKAKPAWITDWRKKQEATEVQTYGESTTKFNFENLFGRRYREICKILSGASDVGHRGALLILLVMRMPGGGPVFSHIRKKLTNTSFDYLKKKISGISAGGGLPGCFS